MVEISARVMTYRDRVFWQRTQPRGPVSSHAGLREIGFDLFSGSFRACQSSRTDFRFGHLAVARRV